jgi:sulfopyruvate decarboxylase subunit beta
MKRIECLRILAPLVTDQLVVVGIAGQFWEWAHLSDHEGTLSVSAMGGAAATALGLALALPHRRVISIDGDGSTLLDLPVMATIATYQPTNLSVFVFDNEMYSGSTISNPTATAFRTKLELMARGAGIEQAEVIGDVAAFEMRARLATAADGGLQYVVVKVEEDTSSRKLPKPKQDFVENKYRFVRYIERTEKIEILPTVR